MAQVSKYRYLLNQYPETVQKEQFRIICHISKRTARYLLQSGLVPCVQSGKKTRNYTIKMKDIVRYLERREIHPEKYKLPPGSYSGTYAVKPLLPESVTTEELRKYYIESFRDIPDIVSTREAAELTGATASTVAKWIRTKKLKALSHGPAFIIPKVNLIDFMASDAYLNGGIEKVQKLIADSLERTGLSPRYTRPDEKKKDIFPPKEKDENRVFAKDLMGNKHYYYRFYNENGIELYTMEKKREFFQTVYIPCDGFMVGIDQRHRLEEVLKWLPTLEHGIRGEIERVFNQSMEAPDRWADLGFANLLGRYEEAKAHNAPIAAERQRQADERRAQQDAREQQLAQERQARYDSAIREAEGNIMAGKEVINREINGKSLIMQLFREHEIPVPLKTQGWIINSLHSIRYDPKIGEWNYRYFKGSRNSTKMFDLLSKLSAAIQTRQQFEEHGASPPDSPVLDYEEEQDMEL